MKKLFLSIFIFMMIWLLTACNMEMDIHKDGSGEMRMSVPNTMGVSEAELRKQVQKSLDELNAKNKDANFRLKSIVYNEGNYDVTTQFDSIEAQDSNYYKGSVRDFYENTPNLLKDIVSAKDKSDIAVESIKNSSSLQIIYFDDLATFLPVKIKAPSEIIYFSKGTEPLSEGRALIRAKGAFVIYKNASLPVIPLILGGIIVVLVIILLASLFRQKKTHQFKEEPTLVFIEEESSQESLSEDKVEAESLISDTSHQDKNDIE